jgi:hypothetical protein
MINLKFPVTVATGGGGRLKIAKNHYFALGVFPKKTFKTAFLVPQLLN